MMMMMMMMMTTMMMMLASGPSRSPLEVLAHRVDDLIITTTTAEVKISIFPFSKHKLFHSGPRIQPYAMILKWRGMRWSPPSFLGGAVA